MIIAFLHEKILGAGWLFKIKICNIKKPKICNHISYFDVNCFFFMKSMCIAILTETSFLDQSSRVVMEQQKEKTQNTSKY